MSKKTVKRHYKRHYKRSYRKRFKKRIKRTYKKRVKRINNGTGKGVQLFTEPKKTHFESVLVNKNDFHSGNMIPGLREM